MLGPILLSLHNIAYYQRLMNEMRRRIEDGSFADWSFEFINKNQEQLTLKDKE
jgi:tRNA-guanine family transglycosylase